MSAMCSRGAIAETASPVDEGERARVVALMQEAGDALRAGGYAALQPYVERLLAAVRTAPLSDRGMQDGREIFLVNDRALCLLELAKVAAGSRGTPHDADCKQEGWSRAALMIGGFENEYNHPDAALASLDVGLRIRPGWARLYSEKGAAFVSLKRWTDALGIDQQGLSAAEPDTSAQDRARLLRGEGFALTELNRYDEAEAVYRRSLELTPNYPLAVSELAYIARVRQGAPPSATGLITSEKAQKGEFQAWKPTS